MFKNNSYTTSRIGNIKGNRLLLDFAGSIIEFKQACIILLLLLLFNVSAFSATYYSRAGGNWNSNTTWSLTSGGAAVGVGVFPIAGDDVIIEGGFTVNVNVASACANLNVGGTGNGTLAYTAAVQLTISNNLVIGAGGGSGTINGMSATTRILSIGGAVTIGGTATFTKGTGTVILTGTSTLPATVFNDFSTLTIQSGTTTLGSNTTVSATLTVKAGATLNLSTYTLGSPTSIALENGTTASTISGSGLLTLGGDVAVTTPAGTGTGAVISCPVALTDATTRTFTIANASVTAGDLQISGIISTTGALTKAGAGILTLSGSSTYTGLTTISAGTIKLGATGGGTNTPLGTTGAGTTVSSGACLDLNGYTLGTAEAITISGTGVSSGGAITNTGGNASYSGAITLAAAATVIVNVSGTLTLSGNCSGNFAFTLSGSGTGTYSGVRSGTSTIVKDGNGTWILSGDNTYTGATTISTGTLKLGANGGGTNTPLGTTAAGTTVASGACFDLNGYTLGTAEGLTISGTGISSGGALTNTGGNASYSGAITLGAAASIVATTSGSMTLSGNMSGNFLLTLEGTGTGTYSGIRSGTTAADLTKSGTGTWTLSGVNTNTGLTTVSAGKLEFGVANTLVRTSSEGIQLSGGTLSTGSGAGYTVGSSATPIATGLNIQGSSTIAFGTGSHTLALAASTALDWITDGSQLTITGWTGGYDGTAGTAGKLIIGSSTSGLTGSQLATIKFVSGGTEYPATILSTGEVVPFATLTAPGGVNDGLLGWFRGAHSSNTTSTWYNVYPYGDAAGTGSPTLNTSGSNLMNYNESYSFADGKYFVLPTNLNVGGSSGLAYTLIGTAKLLSTDEQRVFGNNSANCLFGYYNGYENALYIAGNPSYLSTADAGVVSATNLPMTHVLTKSTGDAVAQRKNGLEKNTDPTAATTAWRLQINGYSGNAETSDAIVPEVITYNRELSASELNKVESYLSLKYGWTLDQTSAQDYVLSSGTTIWDGSDNSDYNNDIAGIARDDASLLNQKISTSTEGGDIITVSIDNDFSSRNTDAARTTAFSADLSAIVWGNNDAPTEFGNTMINTTPKSAFKRVWKLQKTNFSNTFYVQFVDTDIENSTDYELIGKESSTGSWSTLATATSNSSGNTLTFGPITIGNNIYFTITETTPVEIKESASFEVSGTYTFTVPACVTSIDVECWGAGGGGGGNSTASDGAAGGGGGGYSKSTISVAAGATYTLIIGSGGVGGADTGDGTGGTGGDTYFTTSTGVVLVLAKGGSGGTFSATGGVGGAGGAAASGTGTVRYSGGTGSTGNDAANSVGGGGGSSGGYSYNGKDGKGDNDNGAWSMGTPGGAARTGGAKGGAGGYYSDCSYEGPAEDGASGGGGGGGGAENSGASSAVGGAGGVGKIIITTTRVANYATQGTNVNSWTAPAGITKALVSVWGAGGGGGGNNVSTGGGGGGGGGAFSRSVVSVTAGNTYSVTVGVGGSGGTDVNDATGNGTSGGDSWFTNGTSTLVLAKGGSGGTRRSSTQAGGAGGAAASGVGDFKYSGGSGGNGNNIDWGFAGGGGASAGYYADGGDGGDAGSDGACANTPGDGGVAPEGGTDGPAGKSHWCIQGLSATRL